jgi:hypothetical protein
VTLEGSFGESGMVLLSFSYGLMDILEVLDSGVVESEEDSAKAFFRS